MRSRFITILFSLCVVLPGIACGAGESKPNVLIFYIDDLGYGQPGCYGGKLAPTPNMDSLAAGGVRFTDGYVAACICSPSRVGLMTGRYQAHSGHDGNSQKPGNELVLSETTFAQRMKSAGYATGIVGKWHLGVTTPEYLPSSRGFDFALGSAANLADNKKTPVFFSAGELVENMPGSPITSPIYAREANRFMETNRSKTWFLYLAFNAVHSPHVASDWVLKRFENLPKKDQSYAALISEADDAVGTVMTKLRELKLEENTLIFLISDNGGAAMQSEMGGLRGRKWLVWEGGIRVPWIAAWKDHIPAGRVLKEPVIQLDVLPTALAAAGCEVNPDWGIDGVNLLPLLEGKTNNLAQRELYWRFGVQYAIRQGDWKLVKAGLNEPVMLVNLANDPGEKTDLSARNPEKAKSLQALWDKWNATMLPPRWEDRRWNDGNSSKSKQSDKKK